jgi:hypothetical protein
MFRSLLAGDLGEVHLGHLRATADEVSRDARHGGGLDGWLIVWVCDEDNKSRM